MIRVSITICTVTHSHTSHTRPPYSDPFGKNRLGPLHSREVRDFYSPAKHSMNIMVTIPSTVASSLMWWKDPHQVCVGVPFLLSLPEKVIITTHLSLRLGKPHGNHKAQGFGCPRMHINFLELWAVQEACRVFLQFTWSHHVLVMSDNITAILYITKRD